MNFIRKEKKTEREKKEKESIEIENTATLFVIHLYKTRVRDSNTSSDRVREKVV